VNRDHGRSRGGHHQLAGRADQIKKRTERSGVEYEWHLKPERLAESPQSAWTRVKERGLKYWRMADACWKSSDSDTEAGSGGRKNWIRSL